MGSNTKIYESAFYGLGGRYLLLAYQQNGGIVLQNVILPDRMEAGEMDRVVMSTNLMLHTICTTRKALPSAEQSS